MFSDFQQPRPQAAPTAIEKIRGKIKSPGHGRFAADHVRTGLGKTRILQLDFQVGFHGFGLWLAVWLAAWLTRFQRLVDSAN